MNLNLRRCWIIGAVRRSAFMLREDSQNRDQHRGFDVLVSVLLEPPVLLAVFPQIAYFFANLLGMRTSCSSTSSRSWSSGSSS